MKSAEIAMRWATGSHPKGRANNAYFQGAQFYHYGTIIGFRANWRRPSARCTGEPAATLRPSLNP